MQTLDDFGSAIFKKYWTDLSTSSVATWPRDVLLACTGTLLYQLGNVVTGQKDKDLHDEKAMAALQTKLERKVRAGLTGHGTLPPPLVEASADLGEMKKGGKPKVGPTVDLAPAVQFKDGTIVQDVASKSRDQGIRTGVLVKCRQASRGILKGSIGEVKQIDGSGVHVKWNDGSFEPDAVPGRFPVAMALGVLVPYKEEPKQPAAPPPAPVALPDGVAVKYVTHSQSEMVLVSMARAALYQAHVASAPDAVSVRYVMEPKAMVAAADIKQGALTLVPFGEDLIPFGDACDASFAKLSVAIDAPKPEWIHYKIKAQPVEIMGEKDGVTIRNLVPFWFVQDLDGDANLRYVKETLTLPLAASYAPKSAFSKSFRRTLMKVQFHVLTNDADIERGASIVPTGQPPR